MRGAGADVFSLLFNENIRVFPHFLSSSHPFLIGILFPSPKDKERDGNTRDANGKKEWMEIRNERNDGKTSGRLAGQKSVGKREVVVEL